MSTDTSAATRSSFATRSKQENWLPVLELAVEEVFAIMLNCKVKPTAQSEHKPNGEFTAMVGLAGALCGIITVCCDRKTAGQLARSMLGEEAKSGEEVADALGEVCNMIAGNFESGSARMKSASQAAFDRIANLLRPRDYRLRIEGHTDNVPIHTSQFPSNWALSTSRSTEIVRLLIVRDGFAPNRMSAAGYAEYHPVAPNLTAEGRGMNRRVDIVILGHAVTTAPIAQGEAQTQMPVQVPAANTSATSGPAAALKPTVARAASGHLQQ
jgi:outer membrane protein OmpA-like peptidoglycan-associated protein